MNLDGLRRLIWRNNLTGKQLEAVLEAQRQLEKVWKETENSHGN